MHDDIVRFEVEHYERRRRGTPAVRLRTLFLIFLGVLVALLAVVILMALTADPLPPVTG